MPSPLEAIIEQLVTTMNDHDEPSASAVLDALYRRKWDGAVTFHLHAGVPKIIEMGRPVRIDLSRRPRKT